jgi:prephenate dehydrogenase
VNFLTSSRGWRGQVPNEKVPYHECNVQDIMIEDLQKQVVELIQHLAAQNMEMYRDIDDCNSESNFENLYHNPVLVQEQRGRDEEFVDEKQVVELIQHLAAQNMEMYRDIDDCNSESNFENLYHNPVLVQEQRGRGEEFVDEEFQYEEDVENLY